MRNSRISSNSAYGQFWHKSTDGARPGRHGAPGHGNDRAVGVHGSALHHTGGGGGGGGGVRGRIREAQAFNESGEESMRRATPPPPSFVGSALVDGDPNHQPSRRDSRAPFSPGRGPGGVGSSSETIFSDTRRGLDRGTRAPFVRSLSVPFRPVRRGSTRCLSPAVPSSGLERTTG